MSAIALQNLLDYLTNTLSVRNRQWLAAHLIESTQTVSSISKKEEEEAYVRDSMTRAWKEMKDAECTGRPLPNAYDLIAQL